MPEATLPESRPGGVQQLPAVMLALVGRFQAIDQAGLAGIMGVVVGIRLGKFEPFVPTSDCLSVARVSKRSRK